MPAPGVAAEDLRAPAIMGGEPVTEAATRHLAWNAVLIVPVLLATSVALVGTVLSRA